MNRKGRLALILLMFFVLVGCDLFGTTSTTTQAVTTQTTTTRVTTTTRITTTALPTTTVVTTDSPLTVQLQYIYHLAVEASAFTGTYEEWLETVRGPEGAPGEDGKEVAMS